MSSQSVHHILPFDPEVLFDLVADVERYPDFVPGWLAARVVKRDGNAYETDQVVRIAGIRHRFRSRTVLERPRRIEILSDDRFAQFHIVWTFDETTPHHCDAGILVEVLVRARALDPLARAFSADAMRTMVEAFEKRAARLAPSAQEPCP